MIPTNEKLQQPITDRKSFKNVKRWIDDVRDERGDDVVIMLCGNKTDATELR